MEIQLAIAKIKQHNSTESGDTVEVVERPSGGMSVVLADTQSSGHEAKLISSMVVRKVIGLLAEGVRDSAAASAASDYLYTERNGKITATLNILSIDLQTNTIVLSRNNPTPIFLAHGETIDCISAESLPVGSSRNVRPVICEFALRQSLTVVIFTNGLARAGEGLKKPLDIRTTLEALLEEECPDAQYIADSLLAQAIRLDQERPQHDMSVVVMRVMPNKGDITRRMLVRLPIQ
jgi:serine phosphatase RsbU (regulator of sigma subunit)